MPTHLRWLLAVSCLAGCKDETLPPEPPPPLSLDAQLRAVIGNWGVVPIGEVPAQPAALVALGRDLFSEKLLSGNRDIACATCHDAGKALTDGRTLAVGTGASAQGALRQPGPGRQFTTRNAPSLLNGGLGLHLMFWDARLVGGQGNFVHEPPVPFPGGLPNILAAQAMLPVLNRREMRGEPGDVDALGQPNELAGFSDTQAFQVWEAIMNRLLAVPAYVARFNAAFPGVARPRFDHAARALAAFQVQEFTRTRSPFDRYLDRDDNALTTEQKRGALLFFGKGLCSTCHNGPFLGGNFFANVGAPQVGPGGTKQPPLDLGRFEHVNEPFYRFTFRVAPLRNVELTAPYFHSGAYRTLDAVVRHYNHVAEALATYDPSQLDPEVRHLYHGEPETIAAVLETLDGRLRQPLNLSDTEIAELVAFLKSLTDPAAR